MDPAEHQTSILYSSPDCDIFVIDIPKSIQLAQGSPQHPCTRRLFSRAPLQEPLPSSEPKSDRARRKILSRGQEAGQYETLEAVKAAFERIAHFGPFNLHRVHERRPRKDQSDDMSNSGDDLNSSSLVALFASLIQYSQVAFAVTGPTFQLSHISTTWHCWTPTHTNLTDRIAELLIQVPSSPTVYKFYVPPHSTLLLYSLPLPSPALTPVPTKGFDLILLDPPWPNRSAQRSSSYSTAQSFNDVRRQLENLNLPMYLALDGTGIIALWTTNNTRISELVHSEDGWLAGMGMSVYEEWVWVKVTNRGEPILPLDGLWRRPYEVLVLARQMDEPVDVKRRVLFAVPDLHSRKPCLKELFEELIAPTPQHILEIFARNMTAGWHSWGDQVLRFNWEGHWTEDSIGEEKVP